MSYGTFLLKSLVTRTQARRKSWSWLVNLPDSISKVKTQIFHIDLQLDISRSTAAS